MEMANGLGGGANVSEGEEVLELVPPEVGAVRHPHERLLLLAAQEGGAHEGRGIAKHEKKKRQWLEAGGKRGKSGNSVI